MKKYIFSLFLSGLSLVAFSQEFTGGISFGCVSSQLDGDTYSGYNKASITFGGYVNRKISQKFTGQMEMKFIQKGSYFKSNDASLYVYYYKSKLNYIELPVTIHYLYGKFIFEAGISAGYLINSKEIINGLEELYPRPFEKFEYCSILGFNYQIFDRLAANFRFEYSLLWIRENPGIADPYSVFYNGNQFNNVLSFALYYQL